MTMMFSMTRQRPAAGRSGQHGLTLVELMVGLLIGMFATLMIANVLFSAEGYKRSTTNGSDAQVNGMLALYMLQRDMQMAGYGVAAIPASLGCPISGKAGSATLSAVTLAPVVITPGVDGAPDSLTVLTSAVPSSGFSVPIIVSQNELPARTAFDVYSSIGVSAGDLMLAAPPTASTGGGVCSLFTVTSDAAAITSTSIPLDTSVTTNFPASGYPANSTLIDLGTLGYRSYQIANASNAGNPSLQVLDKLSGTATDVAPQIVMLRAVYGLDTANSPPSKVNSYTNATPGNWQQVLTVRYVVVARSAQREKEVVTPGSSILWDLGASATAGGSGAATLASTIAVACADGKNHCLSITPPNPTGAAAGEWQHYRYKIYDTVVPLRNVLWNS